MPSKSPAQKRFMDAIAANPKFAKKAGVPQSVGKEFVAADKAAGKRAGGVLQSKMPNIRMAPKGMAPRPKSAMLVGKMPRVRKVKP